MLVEAFVPRRAALARPRSCSPWSASLAALVAAGRALAGRSELTAAGAIAIDGPALFLQGTLLVLGLLSVLLLAERSVDAAGGAFVAQAAVGRPAVAAGPPACSPRRRMQTEVFPLASVRARPG